MIVYCSCIKIQLIFVMFIFVSFLKFCWIHLLVLTICMYVKALEFSTYDIMSSMKINYFSWASKRIIYGHSGMNLPKELEEIYTEKYKLWLNEVKEGTNKWKDIFCSWTRGLNIVKMTIILKVIQHNLFQIQMAFITKIENIILKFIWDQKRS